MVATLNNRKSDVKAAAHYWRQLPRRIRILYIAARQSAGAWLTETLSTESIVHIELEEALGTAAGLARLRDEAFDALLVDHLPGELDALDLVEGYRAGGAEEPILVLGTQSEQEMAALCYQVGADAYLCVRTTTTRNLVWVLARAVQRHQLLCENHRLNLSEQSRLHRERDEARRLLNEQRTLIGDVHGKKGTGPICRNGPTNLRSVPGASHKLDLSPFSAEPALPDELFNHYRELLQAYIVMGSGNLGDELKCLGELLVGAGLTARQTMQLHLKVLEDLLRGLGARSARHVMTRADLLVLEIMIHLADGYQRRYDQRICPAEQLSLPGF